MAVNAQTRRTAPKAPRTRVAECLVRIHPLGEDMGRKFDLERDLTIGRDGSNAVVIDSDAISRRHARVVTRGGRKVIEDLGSTNGTYVNDEVVTEAALENGDLVRVGDHIFKFLHGSIEALYHEEIYRLTIIDALTEAHNRRYLLEHLEREIARCLRYARRLGLMLFDIDHFKRINDTCGHLAGDLVLRELGALVRTRIRREELFARYGGEEFAIVLPEVTREAAVTAAEALRQLVAEHHFAFEGTRIPVTISVGVALLDDRASDPSALLRSADEKLYAAKQAGRNRVVAGS